MANNVGSAYHPINGSTEIIWEGFSWPCLFFGCFWFLCKGMWGWAIISAFLAVPTYCISWLVFPFFANGLHAKALLKRGYLNEDQWNQRKQGISVTNDNGSHRNVPTSIADELTKLAALKEKGLLSDEEFDKQKRKILS